MLHKDKYTQYIHIYEDEELKISIYYNDIKLEKLEKYFELYDIERLWDTIPLYIFALLLFFYFQSTSHIYLPI